MIRKTRFQLFIALFLFLALTAGAVFRPSASTQLMEPRAPLGKGFTYQGSLVDGGSPANGNYDFTFKLFDAASGGSQAGSTVSLNNVAVVNGLFTVVLDFGGLFDGTAYFLEVAVRPAGGGAYTTLAPRQPLTPAPYAIYAPNAGTAQTAVTAGTADAVPWAGITGMPGGFADGIDNDTIVTWSTLSGIPADLLDGDNDTIVTWGTLAGIPAGFADNVDNDTLGALAGCSAGQVAKWNGTAWACAPDQDTDTNTTYSAGYGLGLSGTTFRVLTGTIQTRVSGACAAGFYMQSVNADGSVNCMPDQDTDTNTTYSAGYGLGLSGTTFRVLTGTIQTRVSGACAAGFYMQSVNADGSVNCMPDQDTDTNTTYSAGFGLALSGTQFSVVTSTVQARVTGACAAGFYMQSINANGSVTCAPDQDTDTTYTAGTGLTLSGGQFALTLAFRLPQGCSTGEIPAWNGTQWVCAADQDTTYTAGTGLGLSANQFSLAASYRLPQGCGNGQIASWNGSAWVCANDQGGGTGFWSYGGDGGLTPAEARLGTTDNMTLTLVVSDTAGLRIIPGAWDSFYGTVIPSLIGGSVANAIQDTVQGSAIVAGGYPTYPNTVNGSFSIIGAGVSNGITGQSSGVMAGSNNLVISGESFIGAGTANFISGYAAAIGSGSYNTITNQFSFIGSGISNTIFGERSAIAGGDTNYIYTNLSFIGGGAANVISNTIESYTYSTIGGGYYNWVGGEYSTIGGGSENTVTGNYSVIAGGYSNDAITNYSIVGGGSNNVVQGVSAVVVGGSGNLSSGPGAGIVAGSNNEATGFTSFVGGGTNNYAQADTATIPGGYWNWVYQDAPFGSIGGGGNNVIISGTYGVIAGGGGTFPEDGNLVTDNYSAILGGQNNLAGNYAGTANDAAFATIGGGRNNSATGFLSSILGGDDNLASGYAATIGGGAGNEANDTLATISGGAANVASDSSFVGGGIWNRVITGTFGVIAGGGASLQSGGNLVTDDYGAILGGARNFAGDANSDPGDSAYAVVVGGYNNWASGPYSFVGSGQSNIAMGDGTAIVGGSSNGVFGQFSTVGGGWVNSVNAFYSVISGGEHNEVINNYGVVGGGSRNVVSGTYATIPGGYDNTAGGDYSMAMGEFANANHMSSFVWSSGGGTTNSFADGSFTARAPGGVRFYSSYTGTSNGVFLSSGSGAWASLSDRNAKEAFQAVNPQAILEKVANLEITSWSYTTEPGVTHIGPVAQDFYGAFGLGPNDTTITTVDADGVALAAIQGLYSQVQEKDARIAALEERLAELESNAPANPSLQGPTLLVSILIGLVALLLVLVGGLAGYLVFQVRQHNTRGVTHA